MFLTRPEINASLIDKACRAFYKMFRHYSSTAILHLAFQRFEEAVYPKQISVEPLFETVMEQLRKSLAFVYEVFDRELPKEGLNKSKQPTKGIK